MTGDLSDEELFAAVDAILETVRVTSHCRRESPHHAGWMACWAARLAITELRPATTNNSLGMLWDKATAYGREAAELIFPGIAGGSICRPCLEGYEGIGKQRWRDRR